MKELLLGKGWIKSGGCNCGGLKREEYQHSAYAGLIIKIYPTKGTFKATKGGKKQKEGNMVELQNYLDGLAA
jgi:hypothetical protein